ALEAEIARMEKEHARLPELRLQVERLTGEHLQVQVHTEKARFDRSEILLEKARLEERRRQRDDLARRLELAERDLAAVRPQLAALQRRLEGHRALLARAAEIRCRAEELLALRKEQADLAARS